MESGIIPMFILGGVFVVLGILALLWSRKEEGAWYGSISERIDVREFLDRSPSRPEPNALRMGGKLTILIGIVLLVIAGAFSIW